MSLCVGMGLILLDENGIKYGSSTKFSNGLIARHTSYRLEPCRGRYPY